MKTFKMVLEEFQQDSLQNFLAIKDTDPYINKALKALSEIVLAEKKEIKAYTPNDKDRIWNACCDHLAKLILGG